jgi:hypothetical protein
MTVEAVELFFSSAEQGIDDKSGDKKIIWKDIMREGEFPVTPGRKRKVPFSIVPQGKSSVTPDRVTISMAELMQSYDDKAFESVTIPLRHPKVGDDADVLNNTGYVEALRIVKKNDKHYLQGGLGFTEPDVAGKVRRGTIPNVSSGVFFDFTRKSDDKKFPVALNHVSLCKTPILDDLEPFTRVYASDDDITDDINVEVVDLEDDSGDDNNATVVWNEQASTNWVREEIRSALQPQEPGIEGVPSMSRPFYDVLDVSREDTALVEEWFKGDRKRWVIPYTIGDNSVTIAPATRWVEVREAMIAASDDFDQKSFDTLSVKLGEELHNMLGKVGENYSIDKITTDGRVSVKNGDDHALFMADFVEMGDRVLLSATSEWAQLQAPQPKPEKRDRSTAADIALSLMFDDTPEGRVAAARQHRRQMMSLKSR